MHTNDLSYVKAQLGDMRPADWETVAEKSGVPLGTLRKIAYAEVSDPRFWTVKKLADYFRQKEKRGKPTEKRVASRRSGNERRILKSRRKEGPEAS